MYNVHAIPIVNIQDAKVFIKETCTPVFNSAS